MRGATGFEYNHLYNLYYNFNSHAPCGAQLRRNVYPCHPTCRISTHTPHAGRNFEADSNILTSLISTHTPHAGRNQDISRQFSTALLHFNSHAPCGAQLKKTSDAGSVLSQFQLTRPMRGATQRSFCRYALRLFISTHTPHAGRNYGRTAPERHYRHFNSHAPCGAQPSAPL